MFGSNRVTVDLGEVTNTCFVVMPFHALYEAEYDRVIRPAVEDAGLICVRGDEIYGRQSIVHDVWQSIRKARLVLAELSGRNPNVMYEIGLAHAIGKPIVFITRSEDDVPFDLRSLRYLFYDPSNPFWGQDLRADVTKLIRRVLETADLSVHLPDIEVETRLPATPETPIAHASLEQVPDLAGSWSTSWLSIKRKRRHDAILSVPAGHGADFVASLTVSFVRNELRTVVLESVAGALRGHKVALTGTSYTYFERGSSENYSLDSFQLHLSEDSQTMRGEARLTHGTRDVDFQRLVAAQ